MVKPWAASEQGRQSSISALSKMGGDFGNPMVPPRSSELRAAAGFQPRSAAITSWMNQLAFWERGAMASGADGSRRRLGADGCWVGGQQAPRASVGVWSCVCFQSVIFYLITLTNIKKTAPRFIFKELCHSRQAVLQRIFFPECLCGLGYTY